MWLSVTRTEGAEDLSRDEFYCDEGRGEHYRDRGDHRGDHWGDARGVRPVDALGEQLGKADRDRREDADDRERREVAELVEDVGGDG